MKRLDNEAGFSLMELILVIMILSVALLPLITQAVQTTIHSGDGQVASTAAFLARERMEVIEVDEDHPAIGFAGVTEARYPDESSIPDFPGYARTVRISPDSTYGGLTYKVVTVAVTPPGGAAVALTTWVVQ